MATKRRLDPRDALRLLAPGPVALVTTMYRDQPNAMTAGWLLPLSFEPALVGVAIHPGRLTHEFATKTEVFALNIPTVDLLGAVHHCGMTSGREGDKLAAAGLTPTEALEVEAPLIADCVAHVECAVHDRRSIGDHDLFVGRVLAVQALDEAFDGVWQVEVDAGQILHHLGADRYAGLAKAYRALSPEEEAERRS
jgi:flavin reductase (DIM6/NTAB) family NADH-FMN oxidoreductase RutF